jgi:hypothetical protein
VHNESDVLGAYTPDGTPMRTIWAASGANTTVTVNATSPAMDRSIAGGETR